ncbi:Pre-mRNA-splicing factor Cwf15/Cwc15 [Rhypophila decipiens]|uniref:Pre-mRNA-splicing factor Cwf15/Cwc15 n=1 Tax=Rhypophila decipiens TaxID=261697 RepID=A0AAN7B4X3_9PEZI|nr:Pre-mRNA-splicing factor Cwf15/Cwc15 [Rhypophila decipiens]
MTTAHRPTFDPARGKEALRGPAYHQRLLPAYTQLKFRYAIPIPAQGDRLLIPSSQRGQGGDADRETRDLRAELLAAEQAHFAKAKGGPSLIGGEAENNTSESTSATSKRPLPLTSTSDGDADSEAKRRRILEESRDIDADDSDEEKDDDEDDDSDEDSDDDDSDDDDAELRRELERIKRERQEKKEKEERERAAAEQEDRERDIATGNPLLNKPDFTVKRRWDDDVVFKNQARGVDEKGKKKEFVNDLLRSDFHKRFMSKYVR